MGVFGVWCIDGDTALVGAFWDDDNGSFSGSVYLFLRSGAEWIQQRKLVAPDGSTFDHFGVSVSVEENVAALIGTYRDGDNGKDSGSAYIYFYTLPSQVGLAGIILTRNQEENGDVAQFKMTGMQDIGSAATAFPTDLVIQFGSEDDPIYTFVADSDYLDVAGNRLLYHDADGNIVRCLFDSEECIVNIRYTDFDGIRLDELLPGKLAVQLKIGGTTYTNISSWTQDDSGSGTWTKYRKDN
ncbi:MAG: hypothetical protein D3923_05610 [Candidatus Electrothrix sp. AR3]|nr:hypothetical protein [Candidatus Electrothrix sp. AR3]